MQQKSAGDFRAFEFGRDAIDQAASDKYDAGLVVLPPYDRLTVTAADMASPLSKKM